MFCKGFRNSGSHEGPGNAEKFKNCKGFNGICAFTLCARDTQNIREPKQLHDYLKILWPEAASAKSSGPSRGITLFGGHTIRAMKSKSVWALHVKRKPPPAVSP